MLDIKLEQFEGPLDLLLRLIEEEKLDITEVSLARVADQYLERLHAFSDGYHLDELSDFIVIAAKLLLIKSRALMPSFNPEEEEDIQDLQKRLKMYQVFSRASKHIDTLFKKKEVGFFRHPLLEKNIGFVAPVGVMPRTLFETFRRLLKNLEHVVIQKPKEIIFTPRVGIREKIHEIVAILKDRSRCRFAELLGTSPSKADVVVSFMALLELVKQRTISVSQSELFNDIVISRTPTIATDQRGNTLIELMTAIVVISVGLIGGLSLATSNVRNAGLGVSRLIAINMAREGIEVARNIRDSNWLADSPANQLTQPSLIAWYTGLIDTSGSSKKCTTLKSAHRVLAFDFTATTCPQDQTLFQDMYRMYQSTATDLTAGEYMQRGNGSVLTTNTPTAFYRTIQLDPICLSATNTETVDSATCTASSSSMIGMRVTADVKWKQGGGTHQVHLRENLYNWR